ncbi:MAG: quinone-dependent dihydroorotate dehydrogenase [Pseudomonadota bacterium]
MHFTERLALPLLHKLDPERAHDFAHWALRKGLAPSPGVFTSDRLATDIAGLALPNPIGLAAGFDKNATAIAPLSKSGFGFLEVGAVTPRAQEGNRKPRLFRLSEDEAAINRFGFNNHGMEAVAERLTKHPQRIPIGLNLGANRDSEHRNIDYIQVLEHCGPYVDFATINVSSPNTAQLRDLQRKEALQNLAEGAIHTRDQLQRPIPIFLKIAPDLTDEEIAQIGQAAMHARIDAIIATNTTIERDSLTSEHKIQKGGLSGRPLFEKSTRVLARLYQETGGQMPLIGVGGISSVEDALMKFEAGATAVQLYTALIYKGLSLGHRIAKSLDAELEKRGIDHISQIVGRSAKDFV